MSTLAPQPCGVHLVGSVPLATAEHVFRAVATALGQHVRRVPDGETGERTAWAASLERRCSPAMRRSRDAAWASCARCCAAIRAHAWFAAS